MSPEKQVSQELSQLKQAVEFAIQEAKQLGADESEVSISKQTGICVATRDQEVETLEFNHDGALGIAVYTANCKGSASTSDLSPEAIKNAVKAAYDISKFTSADKAAGIADKELLATDIPDLDLFHPHPLEPDRFIELAKKCEGLALANPKIKASDGANINSHYGVKVFGNSHGFVGGYPTSRHSISCMLIAGEKDMQRDYAYSVARDFSDLDSIEEIAAQATSKTLGRLGSRKISTCEVPVVFDQEVAGSLFGHLIGAISGGNLYRRSSFLLDSLGKKLFPSWLSIYEDPFVKKGLSSTPFDSEGVAPKAKHIIADGVLESYLLTTYAGRKLGMQSTGHAGGIHNWLVKNSGVNRAELLKQMGTGLLVTEMMGQGVNTVTGDYSRGAAGYWVENGEIAFPVHEITVASTLPEMFANVVAIADDFDKESAIQTGSILISSMKIAGS
ncbi:MULTISPECIES: metalloprotease PmbA [unclassified Agarivorans]|uniref:metalloprotease PmbA n=1 Tax=unclassified Agarivorans TaxID=2636026 RepID=UPI0026E4969B|nr:MULTISPECIES: metalloprotease PmbA [unclassified Agarivorans]MDO6686865.1 metalloprotease PmbA [Agarivorans sp. 3_MG-2023]MDO6716662.1 metalloprotease PmbA [Agarivorans sp. 2_MG-2023]